ncbi:MAG: thioredoxin domain-containing protein, partial [Alphaproteobacteria bacterium]|nr:thioredoxin domain-containing protein [Alphaproteobacteria bacterium]
IMDLEQGGIQGAPKFPHTSLINLFWQAYLRLGKAHGDKKWHDLVTLTLDKICAGGIYDHLGGGFARYVTDDRWLVPHFEKMLYDNGQIIALLSWVWQETQHPIYASRVAETIAWLEREMLMSDNHGEIIGFAASLDADSLDASGHLHEGAFYVWDKAEIDQVLGTDAEIFNAIYDVTSGGNWEGKNIPNLLANEGSALSEPAFQQKLLTIREKLFKERESRPRPQRDDKILADWNGLAILGIARAGLVFDRSDWVALAEKAWQGILRQLQIPQTNLPEKNLDAILPNFRIAHSFAGDVASHPASLDDYAFLIMAAIELFQATGKADYIDHAEKLLETVNKHYRDDENGGYYFAADDAKDVIIRLKLLEDNATPSGQGAMLHNLASLYYLTGHDHYRAQAEEMAQQLSPIWQRNLLGGCSMILASSRLAHMVQIVVFGAKSDSEFQAMRRVAAKYALPDRLLISVDSSQASVNLLNNPHAPLFGKSAINGRATCYVCVGQICSLPIQTADELEKYIGMIALKRK